MNASESYHKQLFLQEVLEHLEDGIMLCDETFRIKFINNKASLFLDIKEDCSSDADSILLHIKSNQQRFSKLTSSFRYSTIYTPSIELIINTQPLVDSQRKFNGLLLILKEISATESAIKQMDWKEKKYQFLLEHTSNGVIIMDDDRKIIDANQSACRIYGIDKKHFLKLQLHDLFPHQSAQEFINVWNKFLRDTTISGFYKYMRNEESVYIDFNASSNILPGMHLAIFKDQTEHIFLEKAFKQTQANLQTIFDNSAQAIFLFGAQSRLVSFNPKAIEYLKLVKLSVKEGDLFQTAAIIPLHSQIADEKVALIKEGEVLTDHYSFTTSSTGKVMWFEYTLIPFMDNKQKLIGYCLTIQEITDRKLSEQRLFASEQKFRKLSENSPDIIYIIDLKENRITYFNRDIILGYDRKDLEYSKAWVDIVHPEDLERVKTHWALFIKGPDPTKDQIEYRLKDKDGQYQWIVNRHSILDRDRSGNVLTVLLNITVITEQKTSAELIKNSGQRLTALVENTNDIIFSIDQGGKITFFNSSFKELFNKYNNAIDIQVGDSLMNVLPDDIKSDWKDSIQMSINGKAVSKEVFFLLKNKPRYFDFSFSPIVTESYDVSGVSVMGRDVTQRKKDEENIKRTNFELDSFVYKASHDLRAPLRSVLGLVNLAFEEKDQDERRHYLSLVEKSIHRLDTFIEDLTNFSRNSRLELNISNINFQQIIDECIENLRFMDQKNPIDIKVDISHRTDFYSDASRLYIVFQNILSNAIKYRNLRELNSYIHIRIRCSKNQAIISISDNGIGIMSEYIDKIFDMFFRASQDSYGSGLGLYITKQVVEKLEGTIDAESVYGRGTTFHIYIPNQYLEMISI